ncbi:MAG: DUF134 domain-containing protein [Candidatus Cloacimonadota bacterium]|nr:DUF134 domain-containing protein [Candidatus Cloacimonadota bacterium]
MARPKKRRIVNQPPVFNCFKPVGIASNSLDEINLSLDEYEALRLADYIGMAHGEAANEMGISRPTFTRLIEKARYKISSLLINGKMLVINGGNIHFESNLIKCNNCGHMFNTNWETEMMICPVCNSSNLLDFAGSYGHGQCCQKYKKKRNQRQGGIMPKGDRTGPDGKGPRTGRGMGKSAGNQMGQGRGTGQGKERGLHQGSGNGSGKNRNKPNNR